jgi:hypothetical protein
MARHGRHVPGPTLITRPGPRERPESPAEKEENTVRTTVLRRTTAAVLLSAAAFGLAACTNAQAPATTYPSQSYGNPPSTAVTTTVVSTPSENPSDSAGATPTSPADGSSMASPPAGAETTTP